MSDLSIVFITNTSQHSETASSKKAVRLAKRVAEARMELDELALSCILPIGSKRPRKQARHQDQAYLDTVAAHDRACLSTGGLAAGSGLHYDSKYQG